MNFRRLRVRLAAISALLICAAGSSRLWAGKQVSLLLAQENGGTVVSESGHNYSFDILILLVLVGGALFAICKSSRRS